MRNKIWSILSVYIMNDCLIQGLKFIYRHSSGCVRIEGPYADWFCIDKVVASPWLFNLFMDNCLRCRKEYEYGLRMGDLLVKCLLYIDDQLLFASSEGELQETLTLINVALNESEMK